eukprot:3008945-Rhodomonas_salina.2
MNCSLRDLMVQCDQGLNSPEHYKIYMLWKCLPCMILTIGSNKSKAAQSRCIYQCCSQFMSASGKIKLLYGKAKQPKQNSDQGL